jgi:hypothetical protein
MEIDEKAEEQDEESEPEAATPDRNSDAETEDEDEAPQISKAASSAPPTKVDAKSAEAVPPRRELPFGRPATRSKPAAKQPSPAEEDDETEDEL